MDTFFEILLEQCQKEISSCLRTSICPRWTLSQLSVWPSLMLLFPFSFLDALEAKFDGERVEETLVGSLKQPVEEGDVCETEAGTKVEVEDEDVDVVGGIADVGTFRYESEGFTLSEIFRRKRLSKKFVPKGVIETSHLPQCEFLFLQH